MLGEFFSWLEGLSGHTWFLAIIFLIAFADSVLPIVPSESMVIIGGVSAGLGQLNVVLVILVAMIGAFLGDNMAYQIGRSAGPFLRRFLFPGAKGEKRLSWAEQQLKTRGGMLLITARFIPGGRTAITTVSGLTGQDRRRFVVTLHCNGRRELHRWVFTDGAQRCRGYSGQHSGKRIIVSSGIFRRDH